MFSEIYRGADKSLARPGRKQATANKLQFLQATQKKNSEACPSNQVSAAAVTSESDARWRPFSCFVSRVGLRTYQHPCTLRYPVRHPGFRGVGPDTDCQYISNTFVSVRNSIVQWLTKHYRKYHLV